MHLGWQSRYRPSKSAKKQLRPACGHVVIESNYYRIKRGMGMRYELPRLHLPAMGAHAFAKHS